MPLVLFRATVHDSNDVFEIVAREDVVVPTSMKKLRASSRINSAGVTIRAACPAMSSRWAVAIASGYQRLLNPSTLASVGITSTMTLPCRQRGCGHARIQSSRSPDTDRRRAGRRRLLLHSREQRAACERTAECGGWRSCIEPVVGRISLREIRSIDAFGRHFCNAMTELFVHGGLDLKTTGRSLLRRYPVCPSGV